MTGLLLFLGMDNDGPMADAVVVDVDVVVCLNPVPAPSAAAVMEVDVLMIGELMTVVAGEKREKPTAATAGKYDWGFCKRIASLRL